MRFAPVGSLEALQQLDEAGLLGEYHLLVAPQILSDISGWQDFYAVIRESGRDPTVMVDNGIIETGTPLKPQELIDAALIVEANYLILPDCINDLARTVSLAFNSAFHIQPQLPDYMQLMGVVQGSTIEECVLCAQIFARIDALTRLCVPRGLTRLFGTRRGVIRRVHNEVPYPSPIHLLGFSGNYADDIECAALTEYGVIGIDSARPIRTGLNGQTFNYTVDVAPRVPDYFERKIDSESFEQVKDNILWVRREIQRFSRSPGASTAA